MAQEEVQKEKEQLYERECSKDDKIIRQVVNPLAAALKMKSQFPGTWRNYVVGARSLNVISIKVRVYVLRNW